MEVEEVESSAFRLQAERSANWSYTPIFIGSSLTILYTADIAHHSPTRLGLQDRRDTSKKAGSGLRSRHLYLGKVALYQMSYTRII